MNKNLLRLSILSLSIALFAGCSTNKECVKVDSTTTKSVEKSSKVATSTIVKESKKAIVKVKAVVEPKPIAKVKAVVLPQKLVKAKTFVQPKPVLSTKKAVKAKPTVKVAVYTDPRDALIKRRLELAKEREATEKSYDDLRR